MTLRVYPPTTEADYGADAVPPKQVGSGGVNTQDEGVAVDTPASTINFVGAGVTATGGAGTTTVTIPDQSTPSVGITVSSILGRKRIRWISIEDGTLGVSIPSGYWQFPASVTAQVPDWTTNWKSIEKIITISPGASPQAMTYKGTGGRGFALSSTASWAGGFYMYYRGGMHTLLAGTKTFFGFYGSATTPGAVEPSALTDMVGFGSDSTDTNLQIMRNDGAGTATKVDLGASFPAMTSSADFYELILFAAAGQTSTIYYQATHWFSGAVASGTLTSNLPTANTEMFPYIWLRNESAGTYRHGLNQMYVQSDV